MKNVNNPPRPYTSNYASDITIRPVVAGGSTAACHYFGEGSGRAKKPALPNSGIDDCGGSRRRRHRRAGVGGLHKRRCRDRMCAGHSPGRWSRRTVGGARLPLVLRRPVVLRRRLGCRRDTAAHTPGPPGRRRWYRSTLSKVHQHPQPRSPECSSVASLAPA